MVWACGSSVLFSASIRANRFADSEVGIAVIITELSPRFLIFCLYETEAFNWKSQDDLQILMEFIQ